MSDLGRILAEQLFSDQKFFRLDRFFRVNFEVLFDLALQQTPTSSINEYELFLSNMESNRSEFSRSVAQAYSSEASIAEKILDELLSRCDFIMQLQDENISKDLIVNYIDLFKAFCINNLSSDRVDINLLSRHAICCLFQVFLRISKNDNELFSDDVKYFFLTEYEKVVGIVRQEVSNNSSELGVFLEFNNWIIFGYLVVAGILKTKLSAAVFSYNVMICRFESTTNWSQVDKNITLNYSVLNLAMFNYFYKITEEFSTKETKGIDYEFLRDLHWCFGDAAKTCLSIGYSSYHHLFVWFIERLEEGLNITKEMAEIRALDGLTSAEQALKMELVYKFSSYRHPITIDRMDRFLKQFQTTENIRSALKVLQGLNFFPLWRLSEIATDLLESEQIEMSKASTNSNNMVVCPFGETAGSTAIIGYLVSHSKLKNLTFKNSIEDALNSTNDQDTIVFLDDCTLSGTQTISVITELLGIRDLQSHHTVHCEELSSELKDKLRNRKLIFAFCIACEAAAPRIHKELENTGLQFKVIYGLFEQTDQKAFSSLSNISWSSPEEREDFKAYSYKVGYELVEELSIKKKWKPGWREQSALGYSDFQRLLVFSYSVPKTTLTFLWCKGGQSRKWLPLFEVPDET